MASKVCRGTTATAVGALLILWAGGELRAQNEGTTLRASPKDPVTRVANRGANFLEIGVGARANALGGAGTVLVDGVHALYWNPANTATLEGFSVGGSFTEIFANSGISHYFVGAALPFLGGVVGVSVNTLDSGDIPRTVETTPSGENVGVGSTFTWTSTAIGLHYARLITDRLAVGATGKWINEGITQAKATWIAADVGVRFQTGLYGIVLGATVANVGGEANIEGPLVQQNQSAALEVFDTERTLRVNLETTDLQLPTYFRFGVQLDVTGVPEALFPEADPRHRLVTLLDFRDATDTDIQTSVAFEYSYNRLFFVRAGKQFVNEKFAERGFEDGLAYGLGLRLPVLGRRLAFDYAYVNLKEGLDWNQTFSFEFGL